MMSWQEGPYARKRGSEEASGGEKQSSLILHKLLIFVLILNIHVLSDDSAYDRTMIVSSLARLLFSWTWKSA